MKTQTPLAVSKLKDCIKELKRAEGYPSVKKRITDYEQALKILSGETVKSREVCPCLKNMNVELDYDGFPYCKNCNPKEDKPSET